MLYVYCNTTHSMHLYEVVISVCLLYVFCYCMYCEWFEQLVFCSQMALDCKQI